MKKNSRRHHQYILLLSTIFTLLCLPSLIQAQSKTKKDDRNILDYYRLLPSNILDNKDAQAKIKVEDIKNGYLLIEGAFEGYVEVALFRRKDGTGVLLVGSTTCGPACGTELTAQEYINDEWIDLTDKILPKLTEEQIQAKFRKNRNDPKAEMVGFIYKLPRFGTDIKLNDDESGELIYTLTWKNGRFVTIK